MKKLTMFAAAILLTWASCDEGKDFRKVAYESLSRVDKECQGAAWAFAPAVEGKVNMEDGHPTFIGNDGGECLGFYSCKAPIFPEENVVLQEHQPLTMVCFKDCTNWVLGPACVFVDVSAGAAVGFVMRM